MNKALKGTGLAALACCLGLIASPDAWATTTFDLEYNTTTGSGFSNASTSGYSATLSNSGDTVTFQDSRHGDSSTQLSITYNPVTSYSNTSEASGGSVNLGSFTANVGSFFSSSISVNFTVQINQSEPALGQNTLNGTLSGTLFFSNGTLAVDFGNSNTITVGVPTTPPNVVYSLQNLQTLGSFFDRDPGNLVLTLGGSTDLDATVTANGITPFVAAPEPSTVALALSGLVAIGLVRLRSSRAKKASA